MPPALIMPAMRSACFASAVRWNSVIDTRPVEIVTPSTLKFAAAAPSTADEIAKLASLRDSGALTAEEFDRQKTRLLAS